MLIYKEHTPGSMLVPKSFSFAGFFIKAIKRQYFHRRIYKAGYKCFKINMVLLIGSRVIFSE